MTLLTFKYVRFCFAVIFGCLQLELCLGGLTIDELCPNFVINNNETVAVCDCVNESVPPWGLQVIRINCQDAGLTDSGFNVEILPFSTESVDLSWNNFEEVPVLIGDDLKIFLMIQNRVIALADNNFAKVPNLEELHLNWNRIEVISDHAFADLRALRILNLSHNRLRQIGTHAFSHVPALKNLNMAWNPTLAEVLDVKRVDLYMDLGLTPKLEQLMLGHNNLSQLDTSRAGSLRRLYLQFNRFTEMPKISWGLHFIDLSGNPITVIGDSFISNLFQLQELVLSDMPNLELVAAHGLSGLPILKHLSFENSRKFKLLNEFAFGGVDNSNETITVGLDTLNLRGTAIEGLNSSLMLFLTNIRNLHLEGAPLICDCHLKWVRELNLETGGRCDMPGPLRISKLSDVDPDNFKCDSSSPWVNNMFNALLIILLIALCTIGIWFVVLGLRPLRKASKRKLASTSPYARVTIEPNVAENY